MLPTFQDFTPTTYYIVRPYYNFLQKATAAATFLLADCVVEKYIYNVESYVQQIFREISVQRVCQVGRKHTAMRKMKNY